MTIAATLRPQLKIRRVNLDTGRRRQALHLRSAGEPAVDDRARA
jgi:hypothetical protein